MNPQEDSVEAQGEDPVDLVVGLVGATAVDLEVGPARKVRWMPLKHSTGDRSRIQDQLPDRIGQPDN